MGVRDLVRKIKAFLARFDLASRVKEKYNLSGWKGELVDIVFGFILAALIYYVVLPALLGASPPAVIVQSCSMAGTYQVGDIIVLKGTSFDDVRAPLVVLNATDVYFKIVPNNRFEQTRQLVFPDGSPKVVNITRDGDVIVYISPINGNQIIHRVIAKVETADGKRYFITKGDANPIPDAAKIDCAQWVKEGQYLRCTQLSDNITDVCQLPRDKDWPGCISTPVPEDAVIGKAIFDIPLLGQIKLALWHIITLGHGYPDKILC